MTDWMNERSRSLCGYVEQNHCFIYPLPPTITFSPMYPWLYQCKFLPACKTSPFYHLCCLFHPLPIWPLLSLSHGLPSTIPLDFSVSSTDTHNMPIDCRKHLDHISFQPAFKNSLRNPYIFGSVECILEMAPCTPVFLACRALSSTISAAPSLSRLQ